MKVSIVIPTHYRKNLGYCFLPMCIGCCENQHYTDWEAIVVCREKIDLPFEEAEEIIQKKIDKSRFRLLVHDCSNIWDVRNFVFQQGVFEVFANFDDDDFYGPLYLSTIIDHLHRCPESIGSVSVQGRMYSLRFRKYSPQILFVGEAIHVLRSCLFCENELEYIPFYQEHRNSSKAFPSNDITGFCYKWRQNHKILPISSLRKQYMNFRSIGGFLGDFCEEPDDGLTVLTEEVGQNLVDRFYEPLMRKLST